MEKSKKSLSLDEALEKINDVCYKLETESLNLFEAMGRVLAENVFARECLPPFDRATFDGYALFSGDTKEIDKIGKEFFVLEEIPAGSVPTKEVKNSFCSKILTGAPIPKGADCVIPFEKVEILEDRIKVFEEIKSGQFISTKGNLIKENQPLAEKGEVLSPNVLSILASGGIYQIKVFKKLKIGVISTGSEVLPPGVPYVNGKIRNSSQFYLIGLKNLGFDVKYYGICDDDLEEISSKINDAFFECDVVVTTGGVSVGTYDLTEEAALSLGGTVLIEKLSFRPGTAFLFSKIKEKYLVGLSGNVGSAYTDLYLFCLPFLKKLSGQRDFMPKKEKLMLKESVFNKGRSPRFEKCKVLVKDGEILAEEISRKNIIEEKNCKFLLFIPPKTEIKKGQLGEGFFIE